MEVKNRLKIILQEMGFKTMVPTSEMLNSKLGGMTLHRFNKLLENAGPNEITVPEVHAISTWLGELTGKPASSFQLVEAKKVEAKEEATC